MLKRSGVDLVPGVLVGLVYANSSLRVKESVNFGFCKYIQTFFLLELE